jgi:hypothetical protein
MRYLNGNGEEERHDGVVRLSERAGDTGIIEGEHFVNRRILGPAVILLEGDPDAFLWEVSPDRERVIGAILVKDTTFEQCTFTNVGIAGRPDDIERIREKLGQLVS